MAREIPCDCMEEKRIEAKSMVKVANCSKECSEKNWPGHKKECRIIGASSAPAPAPGSTLTPASECCQLRISKHFDDRRNNNDDDVNVDVDAEE
mmetsp:Transcript_3913/g.4546  ORF Transcript_3913/g.4546 Transcript_3913/m.4546 type:complete len:94 (+) Transcript_3913:3-284(+)